MPRQPRIEYPGAFYHILARGDRQEPIFEDDRDRETFLRTLEEAADRSGWKIYAWVLMDTHYHLAVETPQPNLVAGMKWLQNTYTRRFNTRHGKWGHLFGGRYKAIPVESAPQEGRAKAGDYLTALIDYIHLNPARAGVVARRKGQALAAYSWSSLARGYALSPRERKPWMAVAEGLALFELEDRSKDRQRFIARLEERAAAESGRAGIPALPGQSAQSTLERGWYWGGEAFREKLLALAGADAPNRNYRASPLAHERDRLTAEEWVARGAAHFGIPLPPAGREHYPERVAIAWALHRQTNQPQAWIAEALGLRSAANVSQQVRRFQKEIEAGAHAHADKPLQKWIELVRKLTAPPC